MFNLANIDSEEDLKELFIEDWNWENPRNPLLPIDFPEDLKSKIGDCRILAEKLAYKIYLFTLKGLDLSEREMKSLQRKILAISETKRLIDNGIFIFSYDSFKYIDFVQAEKVGQKIKIKRFAITPDNRNKLRTPQEQLQNLNLTGIQIEPALIRERIEEAFKVEVITEKFYDGYIAVFEDIKKSLQKERAKEVEDKEKKLKDFIHQVLNRMMFIYFVQKRGCFANDKNFLANFWDVYKNKFKGDDKFHKEWLNVLFFEALCKQYRNRDYLGNLNEVLKDAPYLNGGLFEENELDRIGWEIPDELFDEVFEFFEGYNFTVEESTPLEIDIEINPEMLGNIYELLVNVEEKEEQAKAGIFYTPKTEIELMFRRSLVEFLFNKTGISKEKIYRFVFIDEETKPEGIFPKNEAAAILKELDEILVLDPACGSGHYLVVMSQILYQLKEILWKITGEKHLDKYDEKKKIIEHNIYGNDIKKWAVQVAKLRLWLDLFVDADLKQLRSQREPILPNLNFKIRYGDSLLQRIGNEIVNIRRTKNLFHSSGKTEQLKNLISKKQYVYESGSVKDFELTLKSEKDLLINTISNEVIKLQKEIQRVNTELARGTGFQDDLYIKKAEQKLLFEEELKKEKASLEKELEQIKKYREELAKLKEPPMIWDLAFAEVFMMKNGFDIIIANPPYVRQEEISDLDGFYSKSEYKEKLIEQIISDWQYGYSGEKLLSGPINIDRKSDLYVYFYLKGLKLLNENGVLCYISSNSWLDVGYGKDLQEILLKRVPVIAIYDNQAKRSFAHADVNTIIALVCAPKFKEDDEEIKKNNVRFIMFKKPFEEIVSAQNFIELEKDKGLKEFPEGKRMETEDLRLHTVNENALFEWGKNKETNKYEGNKWGGKYMRAPEIYWKILEKGKGKLVRLGDIAEVRRGFTTGANEFFYLEDITENCSGAIHHTSKSVPNLRYCRNGAGWEGWIEEEFLKPVIKSPRECKSIIINPKDLKYKILMCQKEKKELKGTHILKYIEWGEKQEYHKNLTCNVRNKWYELNIREKSAVFLVPIINENMRAVVNGKNKENLVYNSDVVLDILFKDNKLLLCFILNSTLTHFFAELEGRTALGEGALKLQIYEASRLYLINPMLLANHLLLEKLEKIFNIIASREIKSIFEELGIDENKPIRKQQPNPLPDRKQLDDIVFDILGLTEEERREVYWSVCELVQNRLAKARSVCKKKQ